MKIISSILIAAFGLTITGCFDPGSDEPLHTAIQYRNFGAVKAEVQRGADVNAPGLYGRTPLYYAALCGESNIVTYLLKKNADPLQGASWKGNETPIHVAASHGHVSCVKVLLDAGVPVDIRDGGGMTPLHEAAQNRHVAVIKILLDHGANVNEADNRMRLAPLAYPVGGNSVDNTSYKETVEILLKNGANVKHVDRNGETALHEAALIGNMEVVEILLNHGADPNVSGHRGTPLKLAKRKKHEEIVTVLRKYGAKK